VNNNYLAIIGTILFASGILVLFILLFRLARIIYTSNKDRARPRYKKYYQWFRLAAVLGALILVFSAEMFFWVSGQLRSYQVVTPSKALCSLHLYTPADRLPRLIYSAVDERGNELVEVFPVQDAQVRLTGEIIEWTPLLENIGLGKFFKLTSVEFVRTDSISDTAQEFNTPIHQGSMPLFQRLSGWADRLSLATTKTVQTPVFSPDTNFSYDVFISGEELVLK